MATIKINGVTYPEKKRAVLPGANGEPQVFELPEGADAGLNAYSERPVQNKVIHAAIEDVRQRQTSPYNFKGAVATLADLPSTGQEVNDTYYVEALKYRVTWTGSAWQQSSMAESDYEDELTDLGNADIVAWDSNEGGMNLMENPGLGLLVDTAVITGNYGNDTRENTSQVATPLLRVQPGTIVRFSGMLGSNTYKIKFYDKEKNVVSELNNMVHNQTVVAPDTAHYLRFSTKSTFSAWIKGKNAEHRMIDGRAEIPFASFGYVKNYYINENGGAAPVTGDTICVTNYLPVEPGGSFICNNGMDSSRYCYAFYDESLQFVSSVRSNGPLTMYTVPDGAHFVRFTAFVATIDNDSYLYYPPGYVFEKITPQEFGAVADGKADDTAALQAAVSWGGRNHIPVYVPRGRYLISSPIVVTASNSIIYGDDPSYYGSTIVLKTFEQTIAENDAVSYPTDGEGRQIVTDNPPGCCLLIGVTGSTINNLIFQPNIMASLTHYDHDELVADGIRFELNSRSKNNVDSEISTCQFVALNCGVRLRGKNVTIRQNLFSHCNVGVELESSPRYGFEQREINIYENRFHSMGRNDFGKSVVYDRSRACIKWPSYYMDDTMSRACEIRENFVDYCGDFFSGVVKSTIIRQNILYLSRGALVRSKAYALEGAGTPVTYDADSLFPDERSPLKGAVNVYSLRENAFADTSGIWLSTGISVTPGGAVDIGWAFSTDVWGHGFYDSNDEVIDAVLANSHGLVVVPDGAAYLKVACLESALDTAVVTVYPAYQTVEITEKESSYANQPIVIEDNLVSGAIKTDYSPGLNIMDQAIALEGYRNVLIKGNVFANGVSDPITLTNCDKVRVLDNDFSSAPSYCEVFDSSGESVVYDGTGKHYIKMTDCDQIKIKGNTATKGIDHEGRDRSYVSVPVTMDGIAFTVDSTNEFDVP